MTPADVTAYTAQGQRVPAHPDWQPLLRLWAENRWLGAAQSPITRIGSVRPGLWVVRFEHGLIVQVGQNAPQLVQLV
jgi:hypothetical protein